jgi:hypothetical protein
MFFRSLFYERTILGHLERLEQLPPEVQAEIAMRVGNLIELARPVSDALLERFAQMVRQEQLLAAEQGVGPTRTRYGPHQLFPKHGAMRD